MGLIETFICLFLSILAIILGVGSIYVAIKEGSMLITDWPISIGLTLLGVLGLLKTISIY